MKKDTEVEYVELGGKTTIDCYIHNSNHSKQTLTIRFVCQDGNKYNQTYTFKKWINHVYLVGETDAKRLERYEIYGMEGSILDKIKKLRDAGGDMDDDTGDDVAKSQSKTSKTHKRRFEGGVDEATANQGKRRRRRRASKENNSTHGDVGEGKDDLLEDIVTLVRKRTAIESKLKSVEIDKLNSEVTKLNSQVTKLKSEVAKLKSEVRKQQLDMDVYTKKKKEMETKLRPLKKLTDEVYDILFSD